MFTFFRKKPPPDDASQVASTTTTIEARKEAGTGTPPVSPPAPTRPRTALEWLNTDVSELFARRPRSAPGGDAPSAPEGAPAPPAVAPPPSVPSTPLAGSTQARDVAPPQPPSESRAVPAPPAHLAVSATSAPSRADWVARLRTGLRRTGSSIAQAFVGATIGDELYDDLEAALLQADAGAAATRFLLDDLKSRVRRIEADDPAAVRRLLGECVADLLAPLERPLVIGEHVPTVIMVAGVNGAGKTTTIGKLTRHLTESGQHVLLAAADTFRAAAREQLLAWAERADRAPALAGERGGPRGRVEIVSQEGGDPAGVTFDAVVAATARGCDVVIADTAGRLATQAHLMDELKKIRRVIGKAQAGAPHEVLLVIDGNTGQNALSQVQAFDAALQITGLVITKLDGTAKGGVLAAIALWARGRAAPLPVYFIGVGESLADLQTFRAREFAEALLS
ncbi:MAG: signal recognition particle-docking protein FtsY [Caldimonas sp.]